MLKTQIYVLQLISQLMNRFRRDEEGAALVEYGLLLGLIAVICIVAVTLVGGKVSNAFSSIAVALPAT
jgi:pilus assembly protein Flp/PilA